MKTIFTLSLFLLPLLSFSQNASKQIESAVNALEPLALGGVQVYKLKPAKSVKDALKQLAIKTEHDISDFEDRWLENSSDAWEVDSGYWAESNMKEAYSYIYGFDKDRFESQQEAAKYKKKIDSLRDKFKLFLNTGVQFGVVPLGAVQCGISFQSLAIIDPNSGTIYVFTLEESGPC